MALHIFTLFNSATQLMRMVLMNYSEIVKYNWLSFCSFHTKAQLQNMLFRSSR